MSDKTNSGSLESSTGGSTKQNADDGAFQLHNSDHPGMALVVSPLTGPNYLTWSVAIKTSLEAKDKMGFIDGTLLAPTDAAEYRRWKRVDSMVKAWIGNSISKEIADTLVCCISAKKLWDELEKRYGRRCGPLLYKIQRELSSLQQGTDPVATYYGKLHRGWDELDRLVPLPVCSCQNCKCDITEKLKTNKDSTRLLQFLMGLNQEYNIIRGQILNMSPLPNDDVAFNMVANVESERIVSMSYTNTGTDASALLAKNYVPRSDDRKKESGRKNDKQCNYCNGNGHTRDTCFKLHGVPDWYKELKDSKKGGSSKKVSANLVGANSSSSSEMEQEKDTINKQSELANMVSMLIKQEMGKFLKTKEPEEHVNYANVLNFVGNSSNSFSNNFLSIVHDSWILDTGASSHMCSDLSLMQHMKTQNPPIKVHLPDSATKTVKTKGQVTLHPKLTLHDVLYIPSFKFNLLSVCKLVKETNLHLTFHKNYCIVQDLRSKEIVAVAGVRKNLYILESKSFDPIVIKEAIFHYDASISIACTVSNTVNENITSLWHQRLGHSPLSVINQIDEVHKNNIKEIPVCDTCHFAKQHRLPFPISHNRTKNSLELLHIDVWGPYAVPSTTSAHYVLTIVDDHSRVTWTYLFKFKTEKISAWAEFIGYFGNIALKLGDLRHICDDEKILKSRIEVAITKGIECQDEEVKLSKLRENEEEDGNGSRGPVKPSEQPSLENKIWYSLLATISKTCPPSTQRWRQVEYYDQI
ncbi:Cysteine-rich RLK (receptor-like protein kinase) 8 [Senna tora]|uniref:Cysteine-rich RLK (Receptor-like protein kinase) 8 n=1 Tax=Senna tora TaxID=362788 RepID=A0A835CFJ6_9FABA|nr:Cysteine-rich RLK (receptor-like protein kinase) 8 [Senna tora]